MTTGLSENIKSDTAKIIDIILYEIELRNTKPVSGIFPIPILSKKFSYLEDLYNLGRILDKINEKEAVRIIRVVSANDYINHSYSVNGGPNQITEQSIAELQRMKNISNHDYVEFNQDGYFYFLIEDIERLKEIKSDLGVKNILITYNINIGLFIFNGKDKIEVSGKQKDTADCLINAGKNIKVSWDDINEKITSRIGEVLNENETKLAKKSVIGAVSEINKKTEKYLEPDKLLIDFKESEYWLQYEVGKVG